MRFKDHPQHDHLLLSGAPARRQPRLSLQEALRRLARDDVRTFGESTFGGLMLSLARDWRSALHRVPAVFECVAPADWRVTATDVAP